MRNLNFAAGKRNPRQWRLLDVLSAAVIACVVLFFLFVFTTFGGSSRNRHIEDVESGKQQIEACPASYVDHMPCEDPKRSKQLSREMNFYRERHCPLPEEMPLCLIPPPDGYKIPIRWPESQNKIWHSNMPHNKIADRKGHQGWMKVEGAYFIFPGGGTMFPDGAGHYIEKLKKYVPLTGGVIRTALDMGCGVASFGGSLLAEGILTMSFAPRDSHKSQIQFALERGIPAFVAMLGTRRLPFPAFGFDFVHCSRCLIQFTAYNAAYFIEVDRLLRPGGYLVISGPPVQWAKQEKEWADLQLVAQSLCYELIVVDGNTAVWKKRTQDSCFSYQNKLGPRLCQEYDDPNMAWYFKLKTCVTRTSSAKKESAIGVIAKWPERLTTAPERTTVLENGIGVFEDDTRQWERRVTYYKENLKVKLGTSEVRNIMDANAFLGGFAAALSSDPAWVMNVVPANLPPTLSIIYDRGLIGLYHDWCEPFSTYPRTYDFIHVNSIKSLVGQGSNKSKCSLVLLMIELDRILRPEGTVLVRDEPEIIERVNSIAQAVQWETTIHEDLPKSASGQKILIATKKLWKSQSSS